MMIMEKALWQLIASIPGLDLGAGNDTRIYHTIAPQNAVDPYVIIQRVDSTRWRQINGPSGFVQATIQIDVYGQSRYLVREKAQIIEQFLDGYIGDVSITGTSPMPVCKFAGISCQNDVDLFDETDEPQLHRVSSDYLVTFEQT